MSSRKKARELSLQFLYHFQLPVFKDDKSSLKLAKDSSLLLERVNDFQEVIDENIEKKDLDFLIGIASGVISHFEELEEEVKKNLKNWKIERISRIELTLLIQSAYEIIHRSDIPIKVTINEALELSKKYSSKESTSFINGVLDGLAKEYGND